MTKQHLRFNCKVLHRVAGLSIAICMFNVSTAATQGVVRPELTLAPAPISTTATHAPILASAMAGRRIVAVGDNGTILLSDDLGSHFRQAKSVPVDSTLTSVWFASSLTGWAVGHSGVVIKTSDGGETWILQRSDMTVDQPLFSVFFKNQQEGWAVGLWSLMLHTSDGGAHWTKVAVPPPPDSKKADRNMFSIFSDRDGILYVTCEQGLILKSIDAGRTWGYSNTGYAGSLWAGAGLSDGTLIVGGLRGSLFESADRGVSWHRVVDPYQSSITSIAATDSGAVVVTALDGVLLHSVDFGHSFTTEVRPDRAALSSATFPNQLDGNSHPRIIYFSADGVLR